MEAPSKIRVALSGNPNAGKSTLFNGLTGARQHIANYPGVTVEKKTGTVFHKGHEIEVIDLPGTYSLSAYSIEELVARDFVIEERPDLVVDVVDASNLERNLYLFLQFMELGCPLIIALNMMDVAKARGLQIDVKRLSMHLGVRVVPMTARSGEGIGELLDAILEEAAKGRGFKEELSISYGLDLDKAILELQRLVDASVLIPKKYPSRWLALKYLEGDTRVSELLSKDEGLMKRATGILKGVTRHTMDTLGEEPEAVIADQRYGFISSIMKECLRREVERRVNLSDRIDKVLTNRLFGPIIMLFVLYLIYLFIFWVSEEPVSWFERAFAFLRSKMDQLLPDGVLKSLIGSGIIDGVGGILGYIPLIFFMFGAISVLEDSGYMARIAYMMDRIMRFFGLHGSSVIALIVSGGISGGCAVPGVLATRTLRDPKERLSTALVTPFMNCGGKLPVYAVLISAFFPKNRAQILFFVTVFSWSVALLSAKLLRGSVLRGPKSPFLMELPPYRLPTLRGLLIHSWERTWLYIKRAGTLILAFSILFWAGMSFPGLKVEEKERFERMREAEKQELLSRLKGYHLGGDFLDTLEKAYRLWGKGPKVVSESRQDALSLMRFQGMDQFLTKLDPSAKEAALEGFLKYKEALRQIDGEENVTRMKNTILGRVGSGLEAFTRFLGFDYRINLALLSGVFAKEMVVSTLGTAYSMSGDLREGSLEERLKQDPAWSPALALIVLLFVTIYVPCLPTVITIVSELSYGWAAFSICFNLAVAVALSILFKGVMALAFL